MRRKVPITKYSLEDNHNAIVDKNTPVKDVHINTFHEVTIMIVENLQIRNKRTITKYT